MSSLVDAYHSQDFLFDCTFCTFCLDRSSVISVGALELPASGQWGSPTACASLPMFTASSLSLPIPPYPSLVFWSPSASLSPFPSTPPPFHCFPPHPFQAIWGEAAKGPAGACPAEAGVCQPGISSPEPTCLWETEGHYGYVYSWITVCHIFNLHVIE